MKETNEATIKWNLDQDRLVVYNIILNNSNDMKTIQ